MLAGDQQTSKSSQTRRSRWQLCLLLHNPEKMAHLAPMVCLQRDGHGTPKRLRKKAEARQKVLQRMSVFFVVHKSTTWPQWLLSCFGWQHMYIHITSLVKVLSERFTGMLQSIHSKSQWMRELKAHPFRPRPGLVERRKDSVETGAAGDQGALPESQGELAQPIPRVRNQAHSNSVANDISIG